MRNKIYTIIIVLFSILCGIITKDYFLGTLTLTCGLLNAYYASIGKTYNYIFGAAFCLLNAYISYINCYIISNCILSITNTRIC